MMSLFVHWLQVYHPNPQILYLKAKKNLIFLLQMMHIFDLGMFDCIFDREPLAVLYLSSVRRISVPFSYFV
jgi:hypothetical protein